MVARVCPAMSAGVTGDAPFWGRGVSVGRALAIAVGVADDEAITNVVGAGGASTNGVAAIAPDVA
jgi:hypothetical protein